MQNNRNKILVLLAHPTMHKSRINSALVNKIKDQDDITIRYLYELYPDFHINVREEQNYLVENDIIVLQHPFYWYSAPALIKEYIDLVFEHGFAFGREGKALRGKKMMTAISTGGSMDAYREKGHNHFTIGQFLSPYKQTANLCGMDYLPPFITHGSLLIEDLTILEAAEDYQKVIISLRDKLFSDEELMKLNYINDLLE